MASEALREAWRAGQRGWPPQFPLAQAPNAPLLVAIAAWLVAAIADGGLEDAARVVFRVALAIWALDELLRGVNWFRRLLGAVVLVALIVGLVAQA